jgi:hypothetical protein
MPNDLVPYMNNDDYKIDLNFTIFNNSTSSLQVLDHFVKQRRGLRFPLQSKSLDTVVQLDHLLFSHAFCTLCIDYRKRFLACRSAFSLIPFHFTLCSTTNI